ncbi:hypothetical protein TEA_030080 [Camellia sinensis var. sinensis]|uniref:K Homology domain-containing protein n=1 Tax=Camellia sinensis var. sinensis TaxID=542762 RepID=A0A4S4DMQ1_CAMSN|nr:hypothetical protein TEA_030080 [Camellia sinensis var. sinensis]
MIEMTRDKDEVEVDDEFDDGEPLCPAQDALLKVQAAIANAVASVGDSDKKWKDKEECRILVPASQAANIIGKSGSTIKRLRSKTRTNIKITAKDASDPTHSCGMEFDNFVVVTGEPDAVKRALFAISAIMYKFSPKEEIPRHQWYADAGSTWPVYSSALPVVSGYGGTSRSEELIVRVLCPSDMIGRVIGKGGGSIKSVRQASGARIEVDDKADRDECIISITSTESMDDMKSIAVEAVLLLQGKINDEDDETVTIRLLVPSKVIGCIIGKSGSIINEIRKRTKADVRISKGEKPKCADSNDELVEVVGEVSRVRDALIQIVMRLRDDVLKDREGGHNTSAGADSMYSGGTGFSMPSVLPSVPPVAPMGYEQRAESGSGLGMLSSGSLYGFGSLSDRVGEDGGSGVSDGGSGGCVMMGDNGYGSLSSYSSKMYGGLPPPSTFEMVVPAHAVGKVMGKGGANIANIRKISGAVVEISESKSSRGDRVALISGTSEQKRAAENLIQAFIMST